MIHFVVQCELSFLISVNMEVSVANESYHFTLSDSGAHAEYDIIFCHWKIV